MQLPIGFFNEENIKTYRELFGKVPINGTVIELGSWKGRSICSVADIIKDRHLTVICVDTFKGTQTPEEKDWFKDGDVLDQFTKNITDFGIKDNIFIVAKTTDEASLQVGKGIASLIFIDADHSYEAVKKDITNWLPMLKKGGTISGHDFGREVIKRAIRETIGEVGFDNPQSNIWLKSF